MDINIPGSSKEEKGVIKVGLETRSNPLPDVFLGVKAVLMEGLQKWDVLERFFIAFGGR